MLAFNKKIDLIFTFKNIQQMCLFLQIFLIYFPSHIHRLPQTYQIKLKQILQQSLRKQKKKLLHNSIMRIGSGTSDSKQQSQNQHNSYQSQNNQLKKLHQQRLKRQQSIKNSQMQDQNFQNLYKKEQKAPYPSKQKKLPQNLFLNSLLSDQRNIKDKANSIALSSLFQEDPKTFSTGISKKIKAILMTTYGFFMQVLAPIAQSGVPFILVNDSSENGEGRVQRNYCGFKNMSLVIPPRNNKGYGVFHTKLWLIKFQSFLRVVICTGNQHAEDWIVWLNAYWYQDFPLKGKKISDYDQQPLNKLSQITKLNEKEPKLNQKLNQNQNVQKSFKLTQKSNKQNFGSLNSKFIEIIDDSDELGQISKKYNQNQQKPTQQIKKFNFEEDFKSTLQLVLNNMFPKSFNLIKQTSIEIQKYQFSSVKVILIPSIPGRHSLKDGQMNKFGIAKVKHIMKQLGPKIKKGSLTYNTSSLGLIEENFLRQIYTSFLPYAESFSTSNYKIIYPSYKYITEETCGQASVLYLRKQNYYKSQIKKQVFYHYEPSEINPVKGAIPHLKTVVIQDVGGEQGKKSSKCVFYLGSHNMTKAAWGTFEKSDTQISFSNSQLGLLFLEMEKQKLANFLPFQYPPRKYGESDKPFLRD